MNMKNNVFTRNKVTKNSFKQNVDKWTVKKMECAICELIEFSVEAITLFQP